ncbi:MAG TPA: peptidoglycan DD-metalloendopeptidase family protein [Actinomycetota bacterium]|jgi:murein DD-endopeptidase MepM/ murein hydrolase activator NlpD
MSPHPLPRRVAARALAILLTGALAFGAAPGIGFGAEEELREARQELRETKAKIRAKSKKLNELQRDLNRLGTEIVRNQAQILEADERTEKLQVEVAVLEARTARLQESLNDRNREAYIQGPGAPVLYLLTATSASEAADRLSMITEMNRRDELLASKVEENTERLSRARAELLRLQRARELALQQLEVQQVELRQKFAQARRLYAELRDHKEEVLATIAKYRPFAICPIQGPHALTDSFGIWVHRSKKRGGDHVHQGVDIMAPGGTPIVAPFDGTAVAVPNRLGGKAVNVYGEFGYVYNAHLSAYGQLGPVETGDVIGYVGATGNTSANHDHFEWHPDDGEAADPYPFLLKVC